MKINKLLESKKLKEGITNTEPVVKFQGKSSHTFTKDKKWEVDFDEAGNILARTRHGKPSYFKGHINDKTNDFPSTDEDNIILAAREQYGLKFGNKEVKEGVELKSKSGDLLYSRDGFRGRKPSYGLEVTALSNIYNELLYFIKQDGRSKVERQYRVNITPCRPEDIYTNSMSVSEFLKYYESQNTNKIKEGYSHFEFTSGSNPYIAKTKSEVDRIKRSRGDSVKYVGNINGIDYYKVDDSEKESDLFKFDESVQMTNDELVDTLEKSKYTSFIVDEGDYIKIQGTWRPNSRKCHNDYVGISSLLNKKLGNGNFDLVYEENTSRDGGNEFSCKLRLKVKQLKEGWYEDHLDAIQRKTSGYDKCYKIVKKARTSNPIDTNALNDARDHFGYDLYKMCLDDVLKEMDNLEESFNNFRTDDGSYYIIGDTHYFEPKGRPTMKSEISIKDYRRAYNNRKLNKDGTDNLDEAFKPADSGIQSVKCYNRYNYTIQELRVDNDNKTFERGNFTAGKADKKTKNRQEFEDVVDTLKELGYTEIKSDYRSMRNKSRKGVLQEADNGKVSASKWYASQYPDDEVGIEQLDGLYLDDILKDRNLVGHCDTQVRDRVYAQLDRYSPRILDVKELDDGKKWQYSIGGKDVPYTSYEDAKAHMKDDYKITDYRDELQKYIDKETGRPHTFFVDTTFDDKLVISINWGDWKHEHGYADYLVKKFFLDKGLGIEIEEEVTDEDGSDTYSADHYYDINDISFSGRVVNESKESEESELITQYLNNGEFDKLEKVHNGTNVVWKLKEPINESKSINEDFEDITALADDCGKNTFKISTRDIRFTFENEDDKTKFVNELLSSNIPHSELTFGVVSINKSDALDESKSIKESSEGFQKEFYNGFVILKNRAGDGWDIYSYDGTPEKVKKAYLEDEGFATLQDAKDEIDKWIDEAKLDESKSLNEFAYKTDDLKAFYNTSNTIDKEKYPNFFVWYDEMVKSGKVKINEASYGGAFDIADDQYFTRDDLNNFAEEVLNHINETFKTQFDVASCYIDNGVLEVCVTNDEYGDYIYSEKIDMRKIREPWHLRRAYAFEFASQLINDITQSNDGLVEAFDDDVDDLTYYYEDELFKHNLETNPYTEIESKQVPDSDGFMTDYTMYMNINTGEYVFIFGDKDVYCPDNGYFYFDWECETEEEAREWFNTYNGFVDDEFEDFEESYEVDKVFSAACNNRMDYMKRGFAKGKIDPNARFNRFDSDHSYIMGALRNGNKDMVKYLQDQGGTILDSEQDEYNRLMNEEVEDESPILHKKGDGSYLVTSDSGDGYTAFSKDDVYVGHISATSEQEAKNKFNSNKFDEDLNI